MTVAAIVDLWATGRLPIKSGLYRADGSAREADVDADRPGALDLGEPFDLRSVLKADPEYLTHIAVTHSRELPGEQGSVVCGEGSYGSEGFFARLDQHQNLVWVVYLEHSNPFTAVDVHSPLATFTTNNGMTVTVDLDEF